MKVIVRYGNNTDKAINECYNYILREYRKKQKRDENVRQNSENTNQSQTKKN